MTVGRVTPGHMGMEVVVHGNCGCLIHFTWPWKTQCRGDKVVDILPGEITDFRFTFCNGWVNS